MHKYYFADSCLKVCDNKLLHDSSFAYFENKTSFVNEIKLNMSTELPLNENVSNESTGSGISISDINGEKWIFSHTDTRNSCVIEANRNCSVLYGFIDNTELSDENFLKVKYSQLLRLAIECHLIHCGGVSLHASCIEKSQKAVLFTAPSGTGKSTQANIWKNCMGAKIINGDRPFLRRFSDSVQAYGVPWDGKEQLFLQENYLVEAIVEVRRSNNNSVRALSEDQAFRLMMKQCFIPMWDDKAKFLLIETIRLISRMIPFYRLFCLPDESAALLLNDVLFKDEKSLLKEVQPDMRIKEGFILKNIVGEWIIMPTGSNIRNFEGAIVLNDISVFIWNQLEKPISRNDLLNAILDEYEIDEQTAATDMDELLNKLRNIEILTEE